MAYWIAEPNQQAKGPFSIEQLRVLKLGPETLCWQPGMASWVRATEIPELRTLLGPVAAPPPALPVSIPPPVQPPPSVQPPVSTASANATTPGTFSAKEISTVVVWHRWLVVYIIFIVGCYLAYGVFGLNIFVVYCMQFLGAVIVFFLARALKEKSPWPYTIGSAIPLIGLIILYMLTGHARKVMRETGVHVGPFGANPGAIVAPPVVVSPDTPTMPILPVSPTGARQKQHGEQRERKNSGVGIASFVLSILMGIAIFLLLIIAVAMEASAPGSMNTESMGAMVVSLLLWASLLADLVALGLGIVGLCQKGRKKIFACLGTVFSSVTLAGVIVLILISSSGG